MSKESGGNANAVNQNGAGGSYDVGLWQINDMNWASCSGNSNWYLSICSLSFMLNCIIEGGAAPCDPSKNLECGKYIN